MSQFLQERSLPYLNEYNNVVLDWYNKTRVFDNTIYHNYQALFSHGIEDTVTRYMHQSFFHYAREKLYYRMHMDHSIGRFEKIAKIKTYNFEKLHQITKMNNNDTKININSFP